jgi:hypothetical protein
MSDDGTAGNLFIPALLISKEDGRILKQALREDNFHTALTIKFEMAHPTNKVRYNIWMSSDQKVVRELLHDMFPTMSKFLPSAFEYSINFVLWFCPTCKDEGYVDDTEVDCVSGGKYCAPDPDGDGELTGRDVIDEDLRQLCIHKQGTEGGNPFLWWRYVNEFYEQCDLENFNQPCSEKAMKRTKVNISRVQECVKGSFSGENPLLDDNTLLKE